MGYAVVMNKKWVQVNDLMQRNYRYLLLEAVGKNFDPRFQPELSPQQMLELDIGDIYNDVNFMEGVKPYEPSEEDQGFEVKPRPRIVRKLQPKPKYVTPQVTWDADDLDLILYTPDFYRLLQNSLLLTNRAARMYKGYRIKPIDTNGQTSRVGIKNTKGPTNPRDVYETFDMFKIQKVIKNGKQYTDPRVLDYLYNKT